MDLFTYLMAKKGHNTHRDLFSYLLGKNAGRSGTYTTFSGTSLNISNTLQAKIKNIALEGNASQDGEPTPDTPIPIKVVTGEQNINIQSKNLFNAFKLTNETVEADGTILLKNVTSSNGYHQTYRSLGYLCPNLKVGDIVYLYIQSDWTSRKYIFSNSLGNWSNNQSRTITQAMLNDTIVLYGGYNTTSHIKIMITKNSYSSEYEKYKSQTYPLSLGNIELARIGNYKDYIFKNVNGSPYYNANLELNEWYLHKAIGKATLTENSWGNVRNATIGGTSRPIFYSRNDNFKSYDSMRNILCNNFQVKNTYGTSPTADNQFYNNYERTNNLEFAKFDLTTVAEWKEWLSTHNIVLIGKTVNPTNTKITDTALIQQLENINNNSRSYKDTTIIECTSASTDNETIGFSGDIKVTSVGLGNSLNTSLLSSNLQEETNIDDIQEEPNLDEIEEHNDEPIENEVS